MKASYSSLYNILGSVLSGGPLSCSYKLEQFHYHWGCEDKWGSEHHVDGQSYAGEMHMVFLKETYDSVAQALDDPEGLCVIGIFLQVYFCTYIYISS